MKICLQKEGLIMNDKIPGEKFRYLPIPIVIDSVPGHPAETSAVEMDNFNKRKSLKKNTILSPAHMRKMRKLPY